PHPGLLPEGEGILVIIAVVMWVVRCLFCFALVGKYAPGCCAVKGFVRVCAGSRSNRRGIWSV
ncbi:MAG: hypothetical protein KKA36_00295, partial [Gammaproteobacteria bacterium]|nr:hypothetical protein [Gammaproteobacteria bacterium]